MKKTTLFCAMNVLEFNEEESLMNIAIISSNGFSFYAETTDFNSKAISTDKDGPIDSTQYLILKRNEIDTYNQVENIFSKKELHVRHQFNKSKGLEFSFARWIKSISFGSNNLDFVFLGSEKQKSNIIHKLCFDINLEYSISNIPYKKYNEVLKPTFFMDLVNTEFELNMQNKYHLLTEKALVTKLIHEKLNTNG